jgi:hypothetical protein
MSSRTEQTFIWTAADDSGPSPLADMKSVARYSQRLSHPIARAAAGVKSTWKTSGAALGGDTVANFPRASGRKAVE